MKVKELIALLKTGDPTELIARLQTMNPDSKVSVEIYEVVDGTTLLNDNEFVKSRKPFWRFWS
jgi:O-succinylbenzoate synthase